MYAAIGISHTLGVSRMTKFDLRFWLPMEPCQAESWFMTDVLPRVKEIGSYEPDVVEPGRIVLSDRSPDAAGFAGGDGVDYGLLSNCFPRRIRITFEPSVGGTNVNIRGRMGRAVAAAIRALVP